jgi:hypothetical protein
MQRLASYLMPTLLIPESYKFSFLIKTRNLLLLLTALFTTLRKLWWSPLALWEYWYTGVIESDISIAKVLQIFLFAPFELNYKFG